MLNNKQEKGGICILNQFILIALVDKVEVISDSRKNKQAILSLIIQPKSEIQDAIEDYVSVIVYGDMIDVIKNLDNKSIVGVKGFFVRKKKEESIKLVAEKVTFLSKTKDN